MEKSPTYSPTYSLTYLHDSLLVRHGNSKLYIYNPFSLSLEIRPGACARTCGGSDVEGEPPRWTDPITSIVRSTSAYFDKSNRSTFCASVARFGRLNSRLNRVADTYLLTYLLTRPQSFVEFDSTSVRTMNVS